MCGRLNNFAKTPSLRPAERALNPWRRKKEKDNSRSEKATVYNIHCGAFDCFGPSRTEHFWHCLDSTHDRSAGEGWLFRQGNEHKLRATFRTEPGVQQRPEDEAMSGHRRRQGSRNASSGMR